MSNLSEGKVSMPTSGQSKPAIKSLLSELHNCLQDTQLQVDASARLTLIQQLAFFGQMLTAGSIQQAGARRSAAVQALKVQIARFGGLNIPLESLLPPPFYKTLFAIHQRAKPRKSSESEMTLFDEMAADDKTNEGRMAHNNKEGSANQTDAYKLVRFESELEGTSAALE